jgi:hypothetical protein
MLNLTKHMAINFHDVMSYNQLVAKRPHERERFHEESLGDAN